MPPNFRHAGPNPLRVDQRKSDPLLYRQDEGNRSILLSSFSKTPSFQTAAPTVSKLILYLFRKLCRGQVQSLAGEVRFVEIAEHDEGQLLGPEKFAGHVLNILDGDGVHVFKSFADRDLSPVDPCDLGGG